MADLADYATELKVGAFEGWVTFLRSPDMSIILMGDLIIILICAEYSLESVCHVM